MVIKHSYSGISDAISITNQHDAPSQSRDLVPFNGNMAILRKFTEITGMKTEWALKCLDDNKWNVEQAEGIFTLLKERGAIPDDAFKTSI
ncbi:hypothetical protein GDO86_009141 [Hymenochirus boettgeri]|uniref:TAP-C domain-containing protein n=1 Tax=Hymenochirus boettgeri TaxID=247094 RepID=A0A8T2JJH5_9PIPI|nr:hypothetical protein GDO86_009141 [Hymenochirus boettgeri]